MKMGNLARDKVTGFKGILTGKSEFMNGCVQWLISPPVDKDGNIVKGEWFDQGQVEVVGEGLVSETSSEAPLLGPRAMTGGPQNVKMPSGGGHGR